MGAGLSTATGKTPNAPSQPEGVVPPEVLARYQEIETLLAQNSQNANFIAKKSGLETEKQNLLASHPSLAKKIGGRSRKRKRKRRKSVRR